MFVFLLSLWLSWIFFFRGVVVDFFKGGEEEEEGYLSFLVFLGEFH